VLPGTSQVWRDLRYGGVVMRCNVSYEALMVLVQAAGAGEVSPEVSEALSEARRAIRHTCERFGV
jgi:hypothetical protein